MQARKGAARQGQRFATTTSKARPEDAGIFGFPSLPSTACVTSFSPRWHTSHTRAYCLSVTHLITCHRWWTLYCSIRWKLRSRSHTGQALVPCAPRSMTPPEGLERWRRRQRAATGLPAHYCAFCDRIHRASCLASRCETAGRSDMSGIRALSHIGPMWAELPLRITATIFGIGSFIWP